MRRITPVGWVFSSATLNHKKLSRQAILLGEANDKERRIAREDDSSKRGSSSLYCCIKNRHALDAYRPMHGKSVSFHDQTVLFRNKKDR